MMGRFHFSRSLVARLVGAFLGVSLVTVILVASLAFVRSRRALTEAVDQRLNAVAAIKEARLVSWFEHRLAEVDFVAGLDEVRGPVGALLAGKSTSSQTSASVTITDFLARSEFLQRDLAGLFVLSVPGGQVMAATSPALVGHSRATDRYFVEGQKRAFTQNVYPSPITGRPTLTMAAPIRDPRGATVAVLAADVDLEQVDLILREGNQDRAWGEIYLVDRSYEFVTAEQFGRESYRGGVHTVGIDQALAGNDGSGLYLNYAGVPVIGRYRWMKSLDLALVVEMPQAEAFAPARRLAFAIALVGVLSAPLLAVGAYLLARRIAGPLLSITRAAERVALGDFDATAPVVTRDEIGRLAEAFNKMTVRLRRLYHDQELQVVVLSQAAAALEDSQGLLQAVIDNTTAIIVVADLEGRIILANRAFTRLIGKEDAQVVGRHSREVFPGLDLDRRAAALAQVLATGRPAIEEESFDIQGERRTALLARFVLRHSDGAAYALCTVATDITEVKRAAADRQRFSEQLQHTQKLESLGVLAGGIAHDFNNLLTAILGHADLLLADIPSGTGSTDDVDLIIQAAHRASQLTSQMLAYSGRARLAVELVNLNDLITRMSQLLRVSTSKKVELRYSLAGGLPSIEGDPVQLQQVVMNLISNASEAIGDKAGTITVVTERIRLEEGQESPERASQALPAGPYIRLAVTDTGSGMDEETLGRIFEPFFTTKFTGRGLGLAAVEGIVRGHHGGLWVQSAPGAGTTVRVLFPSAAIMPEADEGPRPAGGSDNVREGGTILVVDDEEGVRRVAGRTLERAGYSVLLAEDGPRGVELFRTRRGGIDAVLLDLTMPDMNGHQVLEALRNLDPAVRVILSSGFSELDLASRGEAAVGVFLQKPYLASELIGKVKEVLDGVPG
jgi:PAS domain S-box-containing protein